MIDFSPLNWHWIVGADVSRAWSSAFGCYVTEYPADRVTRIASETELNDVLRPYGLTLPAPELADYKRAIQEHIDTTARERNYTDGVSLASYVPSVVPAWSAEANAFVVWRDAVWTYAYGELAECRVRIVSSRLSKH